MENSLWKRLRTSPKTDYVRDSEEESDIIVRYSTFNVRKWKNGNPVLTVSFWITNVRKPAIPSSRKCGRYARELVH